MKDYRTHILSILICMSISAFLSCGEKHGVEKITITGEDTLRAEEIAEFTGFPPGDIGFILYDIDAGSVTESFNREAGFIPASTTKVPTTIVALNILGPDYRFITSVHKTGPITEGALTGDLYLRGTGDPLLTVGDLFSMADALYEKGIRRVTGRFFFDESDYKSAREIDRGMEPDESYNSGISALSLDYNSIFARWKPDSNKKTKKNKKKMKLYLTPTLPINGSGIGDDDPGENIKFTYRSAGAREKWLLSPEVDRRGRRRLPVKSPGIYTAYMFRKICALRGIELPVPEAGTVPGGAGKVIEHKGRPLEEIVNLTLTYSINITAELLLMRTARKLTGRRIGLQKSAEAIEGHLATIMPGIEWSGFHLINGSGLTSKNRISPAQMLAILLYADRQRYNGRRYLTALPISGWKWSLISRLATPDAAFHVWAKTGSINYALALAGYIFTKQKKKMAFSIFVNDIAARTRYEADTERRSKKSMRKVYAWTSRAKSVIDSMVQRWIARY